MNVSAIGSSVRITPLALQRSEHLENDASLITAFDARQRRFGEHYNASSHSAVIKLMMLTFGVRPADMFNEVRSTTDGFDVTMKDGYTLHLSEQELQQAGAASCFTGSDSEVLGSAHFALAVFIKRKQLGTRNTAGLPDFASVLAQSLQGETTFNMLKGMGLSKHLRYLPTATVVNEGGLGVADSYDAGSSLIHAGKAYRFGKQGSPDRAYMYTLVTDPAPKPRISPAPPIVVPKVDPEPQTARPQVTEVLQGFDTTPRKFGEFIDLSSHAAVFKLMMLRFGRSPSDVFEKVEATPHQFNVTLKDGFKMTLSTQEVERAGQSSRFVGPDAQMVKSANFMLAAFAKRKQLERNTSFDAALSSTLRGETLYNLLKGMGVVGFLRKLSPDDLRKPDSIGVTQIFNSSGALVVGGFKHSDGGKEAVGNDYGYQFLPDQPVEPDGWPARLSGVPVGTKPVDTLSGFYQGFEGNCVTVSAIKAAMNKFGQNPSGIYKRVVETPKGFTVVMRDGCTVRLTHAELEKAREAAQFRGEDKGLVDDAVFLYGVSAKRAQMENHEFRAGASYASALQTLNDGEIAGDALRRLGLYAFIRQSSVQELASGVPGTLANFQHSVVVIDGVFDHYGAKKVLKGSRWMSEKGYALKLV
ncbi:hypothetical protein LVW35_19060 [Pseudomonas sp. HN11]|uniref:hypothetical protein n=1 Tax=Pseudomonas sp. HN11 TaxID=1344094 RepID=UPI001F3F7CF7|nr:hypothetical protein [Pseudomonas sp. HN11]UII69763.1 hypothetical protein LVW35_19060 [Pseudomonas sp. HN11]